jgi:hypothetical protein
MQRHLLRKMEISKEIRYKFGDCFLVCSRNFDGFEEIWHQVLSIFGFPEQHDGQYMVLILLTRTGEGDPDGKSLGCADGISLGQSAVCSDGFRL